MTYRTARGTYAFPGRMIRVGASGYWVTGAYMGLGENRRNRLMLEMESTFRMLRIRHTAERCLVR